MSTSITTCPRCLKPLQAIVLIDDSDDEPETPPLKRLCKGKIVFSINNISNISFIVPTAMASGSASSHVRASAPVRASASGSGSAEREEILLSDSGDDDESVSIFGKDDASPSEETTPREQLSFDEVLQTLRTAFPPMPRVEACRVIDSLPYQSLLQAAQLPEFSGFLLDLKGIVGVPFKDSCKLYEHQIDALKWMHERETTRLARDNIRGGVLCFTMGLGKTLTTLTHILSNRSDAPTLVVVTKTVLTEWKDQGHSKFFDAKDVPILFYHREYLSSGQFESLSRDEIMKYRIVITTYDVLVSANRVNHHYDSCLEYGEGMYKHNVVAIHLKKATLCDQPLAKGPNALFGTLWERVVCDESQKFANLDSILYKCIMALYGKYKWCLTGTPVRNYETDIFAQLRFLGYAGITRAIMWKRNGHHHFKSGNLQQYIRVLDYQDAGIVLPPLNDIVEHVGMDEKQCLLYKQLLKQTQEAFKRLLQGFGDFAYVLALFTRLRQASVAPFLLTKEAKRGKVADEFKQSDEWVEWCTTKDGPAGVQTPKIQRLLHLLIHEIPMDEKVIVFSSFTSLLDLISYALSQAKLPFNVVQLDGSASGPTRASLLKEFKTDASTRVLLMTYKVGGEGLNLTEANHCVFMEPWWNDAVHSQALARVYRNGQTKPVTRRFMLSLDTIEVKILEICNSKVALSKAYLQGAEKPSQRVGLSKEAVGKMIGLM